MPQSASERQLLQRARAWDEAALAEIYDRYAPALMRYAAALLGSQEEAEECVAEVFARFLTVLREGRGPRRHLRAYLYRMVHNWAYDRFRERAPLPLDALARQPADHADPGETAAQAWQAERLRQALRQLPRRQALVLTLRFFEGFSLEEVAEVLETSVGAVKALQHRGIENLRRLLQEA